MPDYTNYQKKVISRYYENREQIEISKYYERLPKPTLIAVQEFTESKIYYRNPNKETSNQ